MYRGYNDPSHTVKFPPWHDRKIVRWIIRANIGHFCTRCGASSLMTPLSVKSSSLGSPVSVSYLRDNFLLVPTHVFSYHDNVFPAIGCSTHFSTSVQRKFVGISHHTRKMGIIVVVEFSPDACALLPLPPDRSSRQWSIGTS